MKENEQELERVVKFKYMGVMLIADGGIEKAVTRRLHEGKIIW